MFRFSRRQFVEDRTVARQLCIVEGFDLGHPGSPQLIRRLSEGRCPFFAASPSAAACDAAARFIRARSYPMRWTGRSGSESCAGRRRSSRGSLTLRPHHTVKRGNQKSRVFSVLHTWVGRPVLGFVTAGRANGGFGATANFAKLQVSNLRAPEDRTVSGIPALPMKPGRPIGR